MCQTYQNSLTETKKKRLKERWTCRSKNVRRIDNKKYEKKKKWKEDDARCEEREWKLMRTNKRRGEEIRESFTQFELFL